MVKNAIKGTALQKFLSSEAAGGIILMAVAALALVVANSPLAGFYFGALETKIAGLSVQHWVNDALMAVFFLLVGLEIKREMVDGELSTWSRRALPGIAAVGGMVAPAAVYLLLQQGDTTTLRGWAIPAATDIAFALGVLALLGPRVPISLKIFLTALAIIDDLGAVIIIAAFYTSDVDFWSLAGVGIVTLGLVLLNRSGTTRLVPFMILGVALWYLMLRSGVHATVAGVILALTIPMQANPGDTSEQSPLHRLELGLHSWVAFLVVPVFGFANAGVSFAGLSPAALLAPIPLGVALGLFVGKQIGVFGASFLAIRLGLASLPAGATWRQLYGVSILCGIGFTMSLFIGLLAFSLPDQIAAVKIGVLAGSLLSGVVGWLLLRPR